MTTNYNDFIFIGRGTNASVGFSGANGNIVTALGQDKGVDADAAYAGVGSAILNSGLTNPLPTSPNDIGSTYARGWKYSQADNNTSFNRESSLAGALFDVAAGGDHYPANVVTSSQIAYSIRGFLRLDDPDSTGTAAYAGSNVGLAHKVFLTNTNQYQGTQHVNGEWNTSGLSNGVLNGYNCVLSNFNTCHHDRTAQLGNNAGDAGTNSAPRLVIVAANRTQSTKTGGQSQACTGTYAVNTWYHVRFDLVPNGGNDDLKVYTAPVPAGEGSAATEGLGNETWTLVGSMTVNAAAAHYRGWSGDVHAFRYSGYFGTGGSNDVNAITQGVFDPMVDRIQFLTKDIGS